MAKYDPEYLRELFRQSAQIKSVLDTINPEYYARDNTAWGNFTTGVKTGLAGTVEGLGGFASLIGLDAIGNPITKSMQEYQESFRPTGYQYNQDSPLAFLGDSDYYSSGQFARDAGQGVGSLASFLIPQLAGARAVSAIGNTAKVAGALSKMGKTGEVIGNTIANPYAQKIIGSLAPTAMESATEAGFVYNETGDSNAAWKDFGANMSLLGVTNAGEVALAFAKGGDKVMGSFTNKYPKTFAAGKIAGTGAMEGYQEIMQERFQHNIGEGQNPLIDSSWSPAPQTVEEGVSGFIGAMMGGGMGGIGHIASKFGNKANPDAEINSSGTEFIGSNTPGVNPHGNPGGENVNTAPLQLSHSSIYGDNFVMQNSPINQTALDLQTQFENDFKSGRISPQEYQTILNAGTQLYQPVAQYDNITVEQPVPQSQKQASGNQAASVNDFLINSAIDINNKVGRAIIPESLLSKAQEGHPVALRALPKVVSEANDYIKRTQEANNGFFGNQLDTINMVAKSIDLALRDKSKKASNPALYTPEKIAKVLAGAPSFKGASQETVQQASRETLSRSKMLKKYNPNQQNLFGDNNVRFSESGVNGKSLNENPIKQLTSYYRGEYVAGHTLKVRTVQPNKDGSYRKDVTDNMKFVDSLAKIFNANQDVNFFTSESLTAKGVNGFFHKGKMYINEQSPKSAHWIFGHEFTHWMKAKGAKELEIIKEFYEKNTTPEQRQKLIDAYRSYVGADPKTLKSATGKVYTDEVAAEDILADLIADRFAKGDFIYDIANADRSWKGFFKRIVQYIRKFFNQIRNKTESEFDKKALTKIEADFNALIDKTLRDSALDNIAHPRINPSSDESNPKIFKRANPQEALTSDEIDDTIQDLERNRLKFKEQLDDKRSTKKNDEQSVEPSVNNDENIAYQQDRHATGENFYNPGIWNFKDSKGKAFGDNEQMDLGDFHAYRAIAESGNPEFAARAKEYLFKKYIKFANKTAIGNIRDKEMLPYLRSDAAAVLLKVLGAKTKRENLYGKDGLTQEAKNRYVTLENATEQDLKKGIVPFNFKPHYFKIKKAYEKYKKTNPNATNGEIEKHLFAPGGEVAGESVAGIKFDNFKNYLAQKIKEEISETRKEFDEKALDKGLSYADIGTFKKALAKIESEENSNSNPNYLDVVSDIVFEKLNEWQKNYREKNKDNKPPSVEEISKQEEWFNKEWQRKAKAMQSYAPNTSLEALYNIADDNELYNLDSVNDNTYSDFNAPMSDIASSNSAAGIIMRTLTHDLSEIEMDIFLAENSYFSHIDIPDGSYSDLIERHEKFLPFSEKFEKLNIKKEELERSKSAESKNELAKVNETVSRLKATLAKRLDISSLELDGYEASIKAHLEEATKKHFRRESQLKNNDYTFELEDVRFSETANQIPKNSLKEFANIVKEKLLTNREISKKDAFGLAQKYLRSPSKLAEIFPQFGKIYKLAKGSFELEQRLKTKFFEKLNPIFDSLSTDEQRNALNNAVLAANYMGRDLTDKEIKVFKGADDKVIKAYRDLRGHLDMIHRNLNRINKLTGRNPINYVKGYFPHIWDNWQVSYKDAAGNIVKQSYLTHADALAAWKEARKLDDKATVSFFVPQFQNTPNYTHVERGELSSHEQQEMMQEFTLDASDLDALSPDIDNLLQRRDYLPTQHRFFANLMQRKGMEGYSKDVRSVISRYTNRAARYMALEPFKTKAVDSFGESFGDFEKDHANNPLAAYTKQYILDINGNPSNIEEYLNRLIGQIPYLADFLRKHTSYGNRFAVGLANGITEVNAITTLGFFNVATAFVQLSQVMNIYGLVGRGHTYDAIKRLADLSKEDKWVLKSSGILYDANIANSSGYAKGAGQLSYNNKIQALAQKSMWLFNEGDLAARKVAVLAGYHKAIKEGKSKKKALEYAKEVNRRTNYDYSIVDASGAFRNLSVVGQVALQFKKFTLKQGEFAYDLLFDKNSTNQERVRFFGAMFAMAGLMGLPFGDMLDEILKALTGKDIGGNARNYLIQNSGNGLQKTLTHQAIYGTGSHVGVDLSKRLGIYDSVPDNYAPGVTRPIKAMQSAFKHGMASPEFLGNVVPAIGNMATGLQGHPKGMKDLHYTNSERLARALGFIPLRESIERDKRIFAMKKQQEKKNDSKTREGR